MTNDEIRAMVASQGITCDNVTDDDLKTLNTLLGEQMRKSPIYHGTMRIDPIEDPRYMTCSTDQWNGREAVSFNRDGFMGMAGWASTENTRPIHNAITIWASTIRS